MHTEPRPSANSSAWLNIAKGDMVVMDWAGLGMKGLGWSRAVVELTGQHLSGMA